VSRKIRSFAWWAPSEAGLFINLEDVWKWVYTRRETKKRTGERTGSKNSRPPCLFSFLLCVHIGHSISWTNVCIYHLFKDRYTLDEQTARLLQCISTRRIARCGERTSSQWRWATARVDGNWGKASTARKERRLIHFRLV